MFTADFSNAGSRWQLIRLRCGAETTITNLSREFFQLTTHFSHVTVPCAGDGCALCEMLPARGSLYLAAMCQGRLSIVECGVHSANDIEQHAKLLHGGLQPGLVFRLRRVTRKGTIHSEVLELLPGVAPVPIRTLAQRVLAIYKLPCCNPEETLEAYECRIRAIVLRRNEHHARALMQRISQRV